MSLKLIQGMLGNRLDLGSIEGKVLVGIVGDAPSQYAKSPSIWNPTFAALGMDAIYVPFDVPEERLEKVVSALGNVEDLAGFNVTVPYKVQILPLLDDVDERARRINAVNTVVRSPDGRLVGYNTDGQGFIDSLTKMQAADGVPLVSSLTRMKVLLLGAGGAARAIAHYLVDEVGSGKVVIANRSLENGRLLAGELNRVRPGSAEAIGEGEIGELASRVDLIVNSTVKGQAGIRKLPGGLATCLEPYSSLAPASPGKFSDAAASSLDFYRGWFRESWKDIEGNHLASVRIIQEIPSKVALCDIVYAPFETVFLWQGRLSGHRILNGKGMNVAQAAGGFFHRVFRHYLEERRLYTDETYRKVLGTMSQVW